ncbi:ERF family protein [Microbulbifer sp. TRSA001]|uniref:ERF family protein n=1 Tax=Microbulbifer sp. TRSA001 TaxID=3243381 RepID=UPI004039E953
MSESNQVMAKPGAQPAPAQPVSEATQMLAVIERVAANPEADIDKLERLLDMQERIMNRNAEQAFNTAMAQMQAELPVVDKNGEIIVKGTLRSKFAKLDDIQEACKPFLKKYGFAVSFRIQNTERDVCISGILMHNQGHREETEITLPADGSGSKNNVQSIGSSVSYGKRYVYGALLDITIKGEDTDGVPPR